jgi:hypothetical protein
MSNHILVTGCSYTQDAEWPAVLFPDACITNLGRHGAGNRYISDSVVFNIDQSNTPDFVFALFSGVTRAELLVPSTTASQQYADTYKYYGTVGDTIYFFSGADKYNQQLVENYNRVKDQSWPVVRGVDDFLQLDSVIKQECLKSGLVHFDKWDLPQLVQSGLMVNYLSNPTFLQSQTLRAIINFQTYLELHTIPYMFGFIHDVHDTKNNQLQGLGTLNKHNSLYRCINWDKCVKLNPYQFGIKHNYLQNDNFHLTQAGMNEWAKQIKHYF